MSLYHNITTTHNKGMFTNLEWQWIIYLSVLGDQQLVHSTAPVPPGLSNRITAAMLLALTPNTLTSHQLNPAEPFF